MGDINDIFAVEKDITNLCTDRCFVCICTYLLNISKTTSTKENLNRRQRKWKMTSIKDDLNKR